MTAQTRTIYCVRHGESEANVSHTLANRSLTHGLTELGRSQARSLASNLTSSGIREVYSSPLLRARETADIVTEYLELDFKVSEALREYDVGTLEGQADRASWQQYTELEGAWLLRQEWYRRHPGGESFHDIAARFGPFFERVCKDGSDPILIVTHGGLLRLMLAHFVSGLGYLRAHDIPIPNCGIVQLSATSSEVRCISWCGTKL